jgi:hypothetical protein
MANVYRNEGGMGQPGHRHLTTIQKVWKVWTQNLVF